MGRMHGELDALHKKYEVGISPGLTINVNCVNIPSKRVIFCLSEVEEIIKNYWK
ncbi:MAG: hypothetical protein QW140_01260 [Candidatus Aenigmatarchaeota archaeon]